MHSIKETAANVAASAKSGMEKTKATVQEKMERMTAHNATEKEIATERKEERIHHAELKKQEAALTGGSHTYSNHQMSGQVTEGTHQIGTATGTGRTMGHNTHVSGGANTAYGTGSG